MKEKKWRTQQQKSRNLDGRERLRICFLELRGELHRCLLVSLSSVSTPLNNGGPVTWIIIPYGGSILEVILLHGGGS